MSANPLLREDHSVRQLRKAEDSRHVSLARLVESEIIPRLLLAHSSKDVSGERVAGMVPGQDDVAAFVALLLADDEGGIEIFVESWRARGVALEAIFLGLLSDAARRLGQLWADDSCGFSEVTLASWRLQRLMHELAPAFQSEGRPEYGAGLRVLLAPVAHEQHTLGMLMVAEFFRRAGWEVCSELPVANEQLVELVRTEWVDIIGLSVGSDAMLGEAAGVIAALRQASRNINVGVMVGGAVFLEKPELAHAVGADFSAASAPEAVVKSRQYAEGMMGAGKSAHPK